MRSRASRRSVSIWRLARSPRADPAAEALEVAPQAAHAREVVLQLRQLHLQLALGAAGVRGEDVEDHRRAIDHRQAHGLLQVALLAGAQLVVAGDQVGVALVREALGLGDLARAEVGVRVRSVAALHHLADDRHAGGAQQLSQLARDRRPAGSAAMHNARWRALGVRPSRAAAGVTGLIRYATVLHLRSRAPAKRADAPTASSSRSSGVVSDIRNQPSPLGPYALPGEITTAACSSTCSQ